MLPCKITKSFSDLRWTSNLELSYFLLTLITTFLVSIKLSLTYITLAPLIILHIFRTTIHSFAVLKRTTLLDYIKQHGEISFLVFFLVISALESVYGFYPVNSLNKLSSLFLISTLIFISYNFSRTYSQIILLKTLVFGQIVTALYSCIATSIVGPGKVPEVFLGDVTHSGQLALVIPMFIGYFYRMVSDDHKNDSTKLFILLVASIATLSYLCLTKSCLLLITTLLLMCLLKPTRKIVGLSLLITCLIANLKRGPWLGVGCAVVYFLSVKRPKLVIPALLLIIALATTIPVVRNRIMDGQRDFNIAGGRATMWQIGAELVLQYPMGIGYGNSREMREFSFEIPAQHRHFHNNFLNILVETGWPGLLCFLAWIITIVSQINQNYGIFALALLSNQIAGLVEYNFGDSEIIIVLFICLGIFLSESHKQNNTSNHSQQR